VPRQRFWIIVVSTFLNFAGFTIIIPVLPFAVARYVPTDQTATYVSVMISVYALCSFLAAPVLGGLSDRFGRRPILIFSLCGSALGFLVFGLGGALWVLLLGRVIEGLTAGSISAMYAYVADTKAPDERGAAFGLLGAAAGLGFMCGPALGGIAGQLSVSAPLYVAAALAVLNGLWVFFALPESHPRENRSARLNWGHLNPFGALIMALRDGHLRLLFGVAFCFFLAATLMQANLSVLLKDLLAFDVTGVGAVLFGVGLIDIFSQGVVTPKLLSRSAERHVAIAGLAINGLGFLTLAALPLYPSVVLMAAGMVVLTFGDGLVQPSLNVLISKACPSGQQGRIQGANQAQQSIARMLGPLISAWLYANLMSGPYLAGSVIVIVDAIILIIAISRPVVHQQD
jgi:DHA1 family tetracycline resistance protein-like MFS transporter